MDRLWNSALLHSSIYYQFLCSLFDSQIISYSSGLCQWKAVLITSLCCFLTWFQVKSLSCKYVSLTYLINLLNIAAQAHYAFVWCDLTFIFSWVHSKGKAVQSWGSAGYSITLSSLSSSGSNPVSWIAALIITVWQFWRRIV